MSMVMKFDITGYVDCGTGASLNLTTALTFEFWVKFTGDLSAGYHTLLSRGTSGVNGYQFALQSLTVSGVRVWKPTLTKYGVFSHTSSYQMILNKITHVVVTYNDVTGDAKFYVDGVLIDTVNSATNMIAGGVANAYVGGVPGGSYSATYQGLIYSADVYNRILTLAEIQYNTAHPNNPKRQGCVLNLTQESLSGGQWKDLSGNANHGTLSATGVGPIAANNLAGRNVTI